MSCYRDCFALQSNTIELFNLTIFGTILPLGKSSFLLGISAIELLLVSFIEQLFRPRQAKLSDDF